MKLQMSISRNNKIAIYIRVGIISASSSICYKARARVSFMFTVVRTRVVNFLSPSIQAAIASGDIDLS